MAHHAISKGAGGESTTASQEFRRFRNFCANLTTGELLKGGIRVELEPKAFQLLSLLLRVPGEVINYDELKKAIWPDVVIELPENANVLASKLRVALAESGDGTRYVLNQRGQGYYFNPKIVVECRVVRSEANIAPLAMASTSFSRRGLLLAGGLLVLAGVAFTMVRIAKTSQRPVEWRVAGKTLAVFSEGGHELWRHTFPAEMDPANSADIAGTGRPACVFADLDGDGDVETLFRYTPKNGPGADHSKLVCFNNDGKVRWQFTPNRNVVDINNREWTPPYSINVFSIISSTALPPRIVVSSNHFWSFPEQVAVLNPSGDLVSEFWHRGHLRRMAIGDIDGDGQPEVLLGGVNDAPEYKQATLLAFDHRSISGASSSPSGNRYFQGMGSGTEKVEVFFPKTPISQQQEFNIVSEVMIKSGRIVVWVAEDIRDNTEYYVVYEMDFEFHVTSVTLSDQIKAKYRELESKGAIERYSVSGEEDRLKREVMVRWRK